MVLAPVLLVPMVDRWLAGARWPPDDYRTPAKAPEQIARDGDFAPHVDFNP